MNKTYLGTNYDFDFLRSWIKCPFTLEKHEDKALRAFINSHIDLDKSAFGWFFEVYWLRDCQLAQSEINALLKLVDEMEEDEKDRFESNDILLMENHLRYMTKQLMDEEDRYEYFEVFRNQRTGRTTIISDEPEREEEE